MLNKAIECAKKNPVVGLPRMASILVTREGTEFVGYNSRKTHPLAAKFGKNSKCFCLHSEVDAIRRCLIAGYQPMGGTLYVARVLKNNQPAMAMPCSGCQRAIIAFGIKNVEWTENKC